MICPEHYDKIQENLNKQIDWSKKWLVSFNINKYNKEQLVKDIYRCDVRGVGLRRPHVG